MLTEDNRNKICAAILSEGFDYCFREYSDFSDYNDSKLSELISKYKMIADEIEEYVQLDDYVDELEELED